VRVLVLGFFVFLSAVSSGFSPVLDPRARLGLINVLSLLVFSNGINNGISDIRDVRPGIMACLEIWVKGNARSLKVTSFIYDFVIVNIAVS